MEFVRCQLLCSGILCVCTCHPSLYACQCVSVGFCVSLCAEHFPFDLCVCVNVSVFSVCICVYPYVETHRCAFLEISEDAYVYLCIQLLSYKKRAQGAGDPWATQVEDIWGPPHIPTHIHDVHRYIHKCTQGGVPGWLSLVSI